MKALAPALAAAVALACVAGCFGLPPGAAEHGDLVLVRYTAVDLDSGATLRNNRTASFEVGSGLSGLGLAFERAVRGHAEGDNLTVEVREDPSLAFGGTAEVDRALPAIPRNQTAPRREFDATPFGPAAVGKSFTPYGIYAGVVTAVTNDTVAFTVSARPGQEDPVPAVGAVLVTEQDATHLQRSLRPIPNATFTIQPPSPQAPSTPLGLEPGSYKVLGATDTKIQYAHSASTAADLIGKPLRYHIQVLRVTPSGDEAGPVEVEGKPNYGVRSSPQVGGDPFAALEGEAPAEGEGDGHDH